MIIREAAAADFAAIWPIFHEVVAAGDTYSYAPEISQEEARRQWLELPNRTYVAEDDGQVLGTYYLKTNHQGPGSHVCNCGYMVSSQARGKGVSTAMCKEILYLAILEYLGPSFLFWEGILF